MDTIYIEEAIAEHPRVSEICQRVNKNAQIIYCDNYKEVFNPKSQNFRVQKQSPKLILAEKVAPRVLPTPEGFGIGGQQNFYFSHMLNCVYDCRYCFLQGMYPSANYVLFVNYEDFAADIAAQTKAQQEPSYFFSGYDCDSLAMEHLTGFAEFFVPVFAELPNAILEFRTKSTNVRRLLSLAPIPNAVVAFSFTPAEISAQVEHKVPAFNKRLQAMAALAEQGWKIGLRFDPLIYADNFDELYTQLLAAIFSHIDNDHIHSVSLGPLRFPEAMYQRIIKMYPDDVLLNQPLQKRQNSFSYSQACEEELAAVVRRELRKHQVQGRIFACHVL